MLKIEKVLQNSKYLPGCQVSTSRSTRWSWRWRWWGGWWWSPSSCASDGRWSSPRRCSPFCNFCIFFIIFVFCETVIVKQDHHRYIQIEIWKCNLYNNESVTRIKIAMRGSFPLLLFCTFVFFAYFIKPKTILTFSSFCICCTFVFLLSRRFLPDRRWGWRQDRFYQFVRPCNQAGGFGSP